MFPPHLGHYSVPIFLQLLATYVSESLRPLQHGEVLKRYIADLLLLCRKILVAFPVLGSLLHGRYMHATGQNP